MSSVSNSQLPRSVAPAQPEFDFSKSFQPGPLSHEPLLTIAEACSLFNVEPHVLRRAIKEGSIPSYRLGNGRIRLRASDINAAIEASRSGGAK
jgi:excisionase family DNA binding protein